MESKRHLFLVLGLGLLLVPHSPLAGQSLEPVRYESSASIMGSVFTVAAYGPERSELASSAQAALEEARRIDRLLSNYRSDSELSRLNELAAHDPVHVSEELFALLERCFDYSRASDGGFDITVGSLMKVWGFFRGSGRLPGQVAIQRALQRVGYQHVRLDPVRQTAYFGKSGLTLDPGGIGKGYAVSRMAEILGRAGVTAAFISAGGSSMYGLGAPPQEPRGWFVRIRNPEQRDETAAVVYLNNESLSTSGSYEKFFEVNGQVYSHIMDPRTGMPAQEVSSVSVLSADPLDSEAWTTAFFVNGLEWSERHVPGGLRVFFCPKHGTCRWLGEEAE